MDIANYIDRFIRILRASGIHDRRILAAIRALPRHHFIDQYYRPTKTGRRLVRVSDPPTAQQLYHIYADRALPTHRNPPSSSSQPILVAGMLRRLGLRKGMSVLEIGAGTGWNAALMGHLVGDAGRITTVDIQKDVTRRARRHLRRVGCENVKVVSGDGFRGHAASAPFDRIVTTVATPTIPGPWIEQLKPSGLMLVMLQESPGDGWDLMLKLKKHRGTVSGCVDGLAGFMVLTGKLATRRFTREETLDLADGRRRSSRPAPWMGVTGGRRSNVRRDVLFFAQLNGFTVRPVSSHRHVLQYPGLDAVLDVEPESVDCYGDRSVADRLDTLFNEWADIGAPQRTDYAVTLGDQPPASKAWLLERGQTHFWFSFDGSRASR